MSEQQFRTVAFGGFHKQDVLNYVETSSRQHREKVAVLNRNLEEARKAASEAEKKAADAAVREEELSARAEALAAELKEKSDALDAIRAELEEKTARLVRVEEELSAAQSRLSRSEADAEAYAGVKDRVAGIELDAHYRAQAVQAEAEKKAQETREQVSQWLTRVEAGYDRLRTDVDATISHASGELERVARSLEYITAEFAEHDTALEKLLQVCREGEPPKAPSPLTEE